MLGIGSKTRVYDHDVLYFLHIAKTAGTTITDYLDQQFDQKDILPAKRWEEAFDLLKPKDMKYGANPFAKYKLIRGHFGYGIHHQIGKKPDYVTMLRDPVEHTISSFNHLKNDYKTNPNFHHKIIAKEDTLATVMDDPKKARFYNNQQIRYLHQDLDMLKYAREQWGLRPKGKTTRNLKIPRDRPSKKDIPVVKKRLDKFKFVGVVELMPESLLVLADTFGWKPIRDDKKLMVIKGRPKTESIDKKVIDQIKEIRALDYPIYNYAQDLLLKNYSELIKKTTGKKVSPSQILKQREKLYEQVYETMKEGK